MRMWRGRPISANLKQNSFGVTSSTGIRRKSARSEWKFHSPRSRLLVRIVSGLPVIRAQSHWHIACCTCHDHCKYVDDDEPRDSQRNYYLVEPPALRRGFERGRERPVQKFAVSRL